MAALTPAARLSLRRACGSRTGQSVARVGQRRGWQPYTSVSRRGGAVVVKVRSLGRGRAGEGKLGDDLPAQHPRQREWGHIRKLNIVPRGWGWGRGCRLPGALLAVAVDALLQPSSLSVNFNVLVVRHARRRAHGVNQQVSLSCRCVSLALCASSLAHAAGVSVASTRRSKAKTLRLPRHDARCEPHTHTHTHTHTRTLTHAHRATVQARTLWLDSTPPRKVSSCVPTHPSTHPLFRTQPK